METDLQWNGPVVVQRADLQRLFDALQQAGYRLVGPVVRDGAIVYDEVATVTQLPIGWTDDQQPGKYRLKAGPSATVFGYTVGPHSWKRFLYPPMQRLFQAVRSERGLQILAERPDTPRYALIGVRACELQALAVLDQVFLGGKYVDPTYQARREQAFMVAVNCGQAGGTCFCASMNTGPKVRTGFDLALTEVAEGDAHYFVAEAGTEKGARVLADVPHHAAEEAERAAAEAAVERAAAQMGRRLEPAGLKELLYRNYEHPHWEEVAGRCLSCANCTLVCPTCFCSTVEDVTDLAGDHAERWRKWDSCFTVDFTHIVGGGVRGSVRSRYRQWLTHKLATWLDQFGTSGCVGCGRCITWCPVGIDLTEEVSLLRQTETQPTPRA